MASGLGKLDCGEIQYLGSERSMERGGRCGCSEGGSEPPHVGCYKEALWVGVDVL
jgi:hypothetical protein